MRYIITIILVALLAAVVGCSSDSSPSAPTAEANHTFTVTFDPAGLDRPGAEVDPGEIPVTRPLSVKARVLENCRIVQAAAERFAAENGGIYPGNLADETPAGDTVIDFLPDGRLLDNPVWEVATEPVSGAAASRGQTGYVSIYCDGQARGYTITGVGMGYYNIVVLTRYCNGELEEIIGRATD